jgi:hypothetical protein
VKKPNSSIDSSPPHKIGVWHYILSDFLFELWFFLPLKGSKSIIKLY